MGVVKLSTAGILDYSKTSNFLSGNAPVSFGAFDLLETTTLTSSASSVTFSGLSAYSDYKHLQIRAAVRADGTFTLTNIDVDLNGDTGANYYSHRLQGDGSSVASSSTNSYLRHSSSAPAGGAPTGTFGAFIMDILDFSSAKNTTTRSLSGVPTGSYDKVALTSGLWNNTAAITSISLDSSGKNWVAGSRFSLYGVK